MSLTVNVAFAAGDDEVETTFNSNVNWERVMNAIIRVESGGNANARNGQYCGAMQIGPGMVRECNNILKKRGINKQFSLNDRFSIAKSKEMFVIFQSYYNPAGNVEKAIRSWNGGLHYNVKSTQRYYNKVMSFMR